MEKVYFGPLYRFITKQMDNKIIIGKASKAEKEKLLNITAKAISKVDMSRTEEQIIEEIGQKIRIIYTKKIPSFSGAKAFVIGNDIYLDKKDADEIFNKNPDELSDNHSYHTIVHESIHKLQKTRHFYKGNAVRGFFEGATELMALRAVDKNRSYMPQGKDSYWNFPPSGYINEVCIMAQLEVLFGKKQFEDYALRQDFTLLDSLESLIGKENFKKMAKDYTLSASTKPFKYKSYGDWQNVLLTTYFDKKMGEITTSKEAEGLLEQLKEMDKVRMRQKGDTFYKEYYGQTLSSLKEKFPSLDYEKYAYQEAEFYPALYFDEEERIMDKFALKNIPTPKNLEEFEDINLDDYKRYKTVKGDKIFEILTYKGNIRFFNYVNQEGKRISTNIARDIHREDLKESNLKVTMEDGHVLLSVNPPLSDEPIDAEELEEIPLNVMKKDIYERMLDYQEIEIRTATLGERFLRLFRKQKTLPPYSEISGNEKNYVRDTKPSWELTPEQKAQALNVNIDLNAQPIGKEQRQNPEQR